MVIVIVIVIVIIVPCDEKSILCDSNAINSHIPISVLVPVPISVSDPVPIRAAMPYSKVGYGKE